MYLQGKDNCKETQSHLVVAGEGRGSRSQLLYWVANMQTSMMSQGRDDEGGLPWVQGLARGDMPPPEPLFSSHWVAFGPAAMRSHVVLLPLTSENMQRLGSKLSENRQKKGGFLHKPM